jgi:hypothetical protein
MPYTITATPSKTTAVVDEYITISGYVRINGSPVARATVQLLANANRVSETTTDSNGFFMFVWKPPAAGKYSLYVEAYAPTITPEAGGVSRIALVY